MLEIGFLQFLADVANPQLAFLPRALAAAVCASVLCAVVGCFVVLRGMAFIGDAVAHAVFPGVAVAFALQEGLITRAMGDRLAFCPPLVISDAEIEEMFNRCERALDKTLDWAKAEGLFA